MRKICLFIAMSLDGYIADSKGSVDWLKGQGNESETIDVYSEFVKNIDTILMGWNTYHQVLLNFHPENGYITILQRMFLHIMNRPLLKKYDL